MDSNKKHIDTDEFWNRTWKIRCTTAADLEAVINRFDFSKVKHVIISTGTNDTDTRSADDTFSDLVKGADLLLNSYDTNLMFTFHNFHQEKENIR